MQLCEILVTCSFYSIPRPEEDVQQFTKKGEGWKRLQIIAESRVKNDPEKYITYPTHKFPLRDQ